MKKLLVLLAFLGVYWFLGLGYAEAAETNWLQFCNEVKAKSKAELISAVRNWRGCNITREEFFSRFNDRAGTSIKTLADFRNYVESPDREMVECRWGREDVDIDHVIRGRTTQFGVSWRPCHPGEFVLIDKAKKNIGGGAIVLSGWCLNTILDKLPVPPAPPPAPKVLEEKKEEKKPPEKPIKIGGPIKAAKAEKKCEAVVESNPSPPISVGVLVGVSNRGTGVIAGSSMSISASHQQWSRECR